jgi:DNA-binding response OmpR family regulator
MDKRIMIVDDDPDLLVLLRILLEHEKFEVLTVDTGRDCLEELRQGFSGIILIDVMMPFMDGWNTIREIVKHGYTSQVKIAVMTASWITGQNTVRDLDPYIHGYIQKPFNLDRLVKILQDPELTATP